MKEQERDEKLKRAGELVKKAVPEKFKGYVKFHLAPNMKKVKAEMKQTIILDGK